MVNVKARFKSVVWRIFKKYLKRTNFDTFPVFYIKRKPNITTTIRYGRGRKTAREVGKW